MAEFVRPSTAMITLSHPSEEGESRPLPAAAADPPSGSSAGSAGRKPRGRPPGSKNKPKPPVVITRESESAMHPLVLELSPGTDVIDAVSAFARRRRVGLSVLSGTGAVANVALRHPTSHGATIALAGRFDLLSLTGTLLPGAAAAVGPAGRQPFGITVAGAGGQVIGGAVAGPLTAAGTVVVVAAAFGSAEFHRLPPAGEEEEREEPVAPPAGERDVKPAVVVGPEAYGVAEAMTGPQLMVGQGHHDMVLWAGPSSARAPPPHSHRPPPPPHY